MHTKVSLNHLQSDFAVLRLCACPRLDFWTRCQMPADVAVPARKFDAMLTGFVGESIDQDLSSADEIVKGRVPLPARKGGLAFALHFIPPA